MSEVKSVEKSLKAKREVLEISSELMFLMGKFLRERGFIEILPVIISPITDPLNHSVFDATIDYYDGKYSLTKSMIFHKQLAMRVHPKIFSFSPNIRLETEEKKDSGRHLIEFTQLDLEMREATREDVMALVEEMLVYTFEELGRKFGDFIMKMNPHFSIPKVPFKKVKYLEALEEYGEDFERILSEKATEPFWLIDIPIDEREFYDKLDENGKTLRDMDLMYPYGFNEASSGGEREYEYDRIVKRMEYKGNDFQSMRWYLEEVKKGIPPSAGCGIGIERLTRFVCNLPHVDEARLFPKVPGELSI
ncbi:asparagine synthetase A [Mesoaciditoga lauensis]|uniref:asparagine synthetase A n=1 Tax=Mesoaciditoga lauensis TaxID=1495039 RepID=UPI00055EA16E|nr:asparagine synthetase A [Mesoaciditoga lauensis]